MGEWIAKQKRGTAGFGSTSLVSLHSRGRAPDKPGEGGIRRFGAGRQSGQRRKRLFPEFSSIICNIRLSDKKQILPYCRKNNKIRCFVCVSQKIYSFLYSCSTCSSQSRKLASLGILQSPRGLRQTEPTLTPSGIQLRLNCWVKNLR